MYVCMWDNILFFDFESFVQGTFWEYKKVFAIKSSKESDHTQFNTN